MSLSPAMNETDPEQVSAHAPPAADGPSATHRLPNPLGGERLTWRWREHDIAYVRRGNGPPMVFVHSVHACAWSMEWRAVVPLLAERFTTFSLDLLGFGASDHPPLRYTSSLYTDLLSDFLRECVGAPAVVVGSSLGGTYAIAVARAHPELVRAVCAIGPAGVSRLTTAGGAASGMVQGLFRSQGVGSLLFSALVSKGSIRFFLKDIYSDRRMLTDEVVELYWKAAHQPNARFAPAAFVGMQLNLDIRDALRALARPLLLVWGNDAKQTPLREADAVRALRPDAPFVVLPGGDLPHEESPAEFVNALMRFCEGLSRTPQT